MRNKAKGTKTKTPTARDITSGRLSNPKGSSIYHLFHKLLFKLTPQKALGRIGSIGFTLEHFYERKLRSYLGFRRSEKYFAYSWIFENLQLNSGRILDVGCGDSLLPLELIMRGYDVYAIDLSAKPWGAATPARYSKLHFIEADIRYAPFTDSAFDCILAVSTLEHIAQESVASELNRILRDDGFLLVTMPLDINDVLKKRDAALKMRDFLTRYFNVLNEEYYNLVSGYRLDWSEFSKEKLVNADMCRYSVVIHLLLTKKTKVEEGVFQR